MCVIYYELVNTLCLSEAVSMVEKEKSATVAFIESAERVE